ncbi:MAG: VWA domain-containing protein, partial [Chromatiales bacterium]|nr:VWA domain-containing protein [Chromatiales bacterium]
MNMPPGGGQLFRNLVQFARTLRAAGLPIGPGRVLEAEQALHAVGIRRRDDFYWTLHAVFVRHARNRPIFDQTFHVFWRNPGLLDRVMTLPLPGARDTPGAQEQALSRRVMDAMAGRMPLVPTAAVEPSDAQRDATSTWSAEALLRTRDFESMSAEEIADAKKLIARFSLLSATVTTRRVGPDARGRRVHMRRTLRKSMRSPDAMVLERSRPLRRSPPLVIV